MLLAVLRSLFGHLAMRQNEALSTTHRLCTSPRWLAAAAVLQCPIASYRCVTRYYPSFSRAGHRPYALPMASANEMEILHPQL